MVPSLKLALYNVERKLMVRPGYSLIVSLLHFRVIKKINGTIRRANVAVLKCKLYQLKYI